MKTCIVLVALMLSTATYGQAAPPAKPVDLSGLSRPELELLCHNLYDRVDELKDRLGHTQVRSRDSANRIKALTAQNATLQAQVDDLNKRLDELTPHKPGEARVVPTKDVGTITGQLEASRPPPPMQTSEGGFSPFALSAGAPGNQQPVQRQELALGLAGVIMGAKISDVVDAHNAIVTLDNGLGECLWIRGVDTSGWATDGYFRDQRKFKLVDTTSYTTVQGGKNTIFVAEPLQISAR